MKIYEFQKNALETVIIQFTEFKGKKLIDMRVFYNAGVAQEDWRPSKKGISMSVDLIPELTKGLEKAKKAWQKQINK